MHQITSDNFNDLYIKLAQRMIRDGFDVDPRENPTREICNVMLALTNPRKNLLDSIVSRNYDFEYLQAEIDWYNSGSYHVGEIEKYASIWSEISDENGFVNSNYGAIMFAEMENGFTQWEWCKKALTDDKYTRQAVINFNQPKHKYLNNKDFVCTLSMQFLYRNGQLDCIVHMRSNDMIYGLAYDLPWFTLNHIKMAGEFNLELGTYYHNATSMHVYERHFQMLQNISREKITSEKSRKSHE